MYQVWPVWVASTVPAAVWLQPRLRVLTLQDLLTLFCHQPGNDLPNLETQELEQTAAGGGKSGPALGPGGREEGEEQGEQEEGPEEEMNPRSFPNTRGALSEEEPEVVDMSPSAGRSPSPISALFHKVRGAGPTPPTTPDSLERQE